MKVTSAQADRFFAAWFPLLEFVNGARHIVKRAADERSTFTTQEALPIRNALWADAKLLDAFLDANPAGLPSDQLATVATWKRRVSGQFLVYKHYKKHSIFMHDSEVYAVLGLRSDLEEILPMAPPVLVETVLLPFEGVIVTDGLLAAHSIFFGPGVRRNLKAEYDRAVERGAVRTSLLEDGSTAPRVDAATTNRKVLSAFRSHLKARRLASSTVEQDMAEVAVLAQGLSPRSLLELSARDLETMLVASRRAFGSANRTAAAVKRFLAFMRETGRVAPGVAAEAVERFARVRARSLMVDCSGRVLGPASNRTLVPAAPPSRAQVPDARHAPSDRVSVQLARSEARGPTPSGPGERARALMAVIP